MTKNNDIREGNSEGAVDGLLGYVEMSGNGTILTFRNERELSEILEPLEDPRSCVVRWYADLPDRGDAPLDGDRTCPRGSIREKEDSDGTSSVGPQKV